MRDTGKNEINTARDFINYILFLKYLYKEGLKS